MDNSIATSNFNAQEVEFLDHFKEQGPEKIGNIHVENYLVDTKGDFTFETNVALRTEMQTAFMLKNVLSDALARRAFREKVNELLHTERAYSERELITLVLNDPSRFHGALKDNYDIARLATPQRDELADTFELDVMNERDTAFMNAIGDVQLYAEHALGVKKDDINKHISDFITLRNDNSMSDDALSVFVLNRICPMELKVSENQIQNFKLNSDSVADVVGLIAGEDVSAKSFSDSVATIGRRKSDFKSDGQDHTIPLSDAILKGYVNTEGVESPAAKMAFDLEGIYLFNKMIENHPKEMASLWRHLKKDSETKLTHADMIDASRRLCINHFENYTGPASVKNAYEKVLKDFKSVKRAVVEEFNLDTYSEALPIALTRMIEKDWLSGSQAQELYRHNNIDPSEENARTAYAKVAALSDAVVTLKQMPGAQKIQVGSFKSNHPLLSKEFENKVEEQLDKIETQSQSVTSKFFKSIKNMSAQASTFVVPAALVSMAFLANKHTDSIPTDVFQAKEVAQCASKYGFEFTKACVEGVKAELKGDFHYLSHALSESRTLSGDLYLLASGKEATMEQLIDNAVHERLLENDMPQFRQAVDKHVESHIELSKAKPNVGIVDIKTAIDDRYTNLKGIDAVAKDVPNELLTSSTIKAEVSGPSYSNYMSRQFRRIDSLGYMNRTQPIKQLVVSVKTGHDLSTSADANPSQLTSLVEKPIFDAAPHIKSLQANSIDMLANDMTKRLESEPDLNAASIHNVVQAAIENSKGYTLSNYKVTRVDMDTLSANIRTTTPQFAMKDLDVSFDDSEGKGKPKLTVHNVAQLNRLSVPSEVQYANNDNKQEIESAIKAKPDLELFEKPNATKSVGPKVRTTF